MTLDGFVTGVFLGTMMLILLFLLTRDDSGDLP